MKETPDNQTHHAMCWKDHHGCAIDRIFRVKSGLSSAIKSISSDPPSECRDGLLIIFALLSGLVDGDG